MMTLRMHRGFSISLFWKSPDMPFFVTHSTRCVHFPCVDVLFPRPPESGTVLSQYRRRQGRNSRLAISSLNGHVVYVYVVYTRLAEADLRGHDDAIAALKGTCTKHRWGGVHHAQIARRSRYSATTAPGGECIHAGSLG